MKKQYKLYYHTANLSSLKPSEDGKFVWSGNVNAFRVLRVDVCTCDNIYTAQVLRDIIRDSLKQEVQIEEVEVDCYE